MIARRLDGGPYAAVAEDAGCSPRSIARVMHGGAPGRLVLIGLGYSEVYVNGSTSKHKRLIDLRDEAWQRVQASSYAKAAKALGVGYAPLWRFVHGIGAEPRVIAALGYRVMYLPSEHP